MIRREWTLLLCLVLAACNSEKRVSDVAPSAAIPTSLPREIELVPGQYTPVPAMRNPYENNQHAISEGQRLFRWFNCTGCHGEGGGGMGPPLIDDHWIYGAAPANIYETIVSGRPNGMPAFGGKVPSYQVWQLVAYVQSLPQPPDIGQQAKSVRRER